MPRVKRGTVRRAKRKKLLARAKGFYQTKSKLYRAAKESVDTALKYAFVGRRRWRIGGGYPRIRPGTPHQAQNRSARSTGRMAMPVTHEPWLVALSLCIYAAGIAASQPLAASSSDRIQSPVHDCATDESASLIAEAPEDSQAVEVLQRAGFAVYLRQDILRLVRTRLTIQAEPIMRPAEPRDLWGIQQLYMNTVPRLAQLAEGLPRVQRSGAVRGYVLEDQLEIVAYLQVRRGPMGAWFNILMHPKAESKAARVIEYGLSLFGSNWNAPIYCSVRRYQEWLHRPLETLGFGAYGSTAVMVKHLVKLISESEPNMVHALESHVKVTAHVARPRIAQPRG